MLMIIDAPTSSSPGHRLLFSRYLNSSPGAPTSSATGRPGYPFPLSVGSPLRYGAKIYFHQNSSIYSLHLNLGVLTLPRYGCISN
jgi:hypothetical protein